MKRVLLAVAFSATALLWFGRLKGASVEHAVQAPKPAASQTSKVLGQRPLVRGQQAAPGPAPILTTTFRNPSYDTSKATWAKDICGGKTFMSGSFPPYEWMQVLHPKSEEDLDVVGLAGTAVFPDEYKKTGGVSEGDVWFTHPFGFDWEFFVAPDVLYQSLLAPSNQGRPNIDDREFVDATFHAKEYLHVPAPKGVLGVETDQDLVPAAYRATDGDRVVLFGRWIVDSGHKDFHTEIHPPLLMVTGRAGPGAIPTTAPTVAADVTSIKLIGRPYFVSQEFGDGALFSHLVKEVGKVQSIVGSTRVEAHAPIRSKPFSGVHLLTFTARPSAPRKSPNDKLMVAFHFTTRPGVAVQVMKGTDSVNTVIAMNEAGYKAPPLPPKHDLDVSFSDVRKQADVSGWIELLLLLNPIADVDLHRDWRGDRYNAPRASSPKDSVITRVPVESLSGNTPFSVDENQPFPIYGHMAVYWERHSDTGTKVVRPPAR